MVSKDIFDSSKKSAQSRLKGYSKVIDTFLHINIYFV